MSEVVGGRSDEHPPGPLAWDGVRIATVVVLALVAISQGVTIVFLYSTAARQERVVQQSLCPLYSLIIGSYNPNSRPAGPERAQYEQAFVLMRAARDALDCRDPLVPPANPR